MSYKLYTDKTETFKCKIHLEGAELTEAKSRLVIESSKFNLLFEGIKSTFHFNICLARVYSGR